MTKLRKDQTDLLSTCLRKYRPDLLWVINSDVQIANNEMLGNALREAVGNELIKQGLEENDQPNKYGLALEDLIDALGRRMWSGGEGK